MKLKASLIVFILALLGSRSFAQFNHAIGAGLVAGKGKPPAGAEAGSADPEILGFGAFYHPRYNIMESESGSLSVGVPLTAGLSGSVNSREGGSLSIIADIPLTIEYNVGAGSSEDNESGFGGFVGGGFGYTYSNYSEEFFIPGTTAASGPAVYEQVKGSSYGPLVHAGLRAYIGERTYFLRASYKMGMEKAKFKTFGVSVGVCL